ncbi:hypothetical protein [Brevibacterium sediminis]
MTKLDIHQIDVDDSRVAEFAAGENAVVKVWFNRGLTGGEKKRAKEAANSVLIEGQTASVGMDFVKFRVRDGGPVEQFVEIVKSDGSKWDDEVAQELKRAEDALKTLESSLRAFVQQ